MGRIMSRVMSMVLIKGRPLDHFFSEAGEEEIKRWLIENNIVYTCYPKPSTDILVVMNELDFIATKLRWTK